MAATTDFRPSWTVQRDTVPAQTSSFRYVTETPSNSTIVRVEIPTEEEYLRSTRANESRLDDALREVFGD